ncbi:MAG: twitching motility protein PilT [Lachnospiraceae bacterium]|nr:twitching motility protein PilT [Lachnospiraceae bacterium]
MIQLIVGAKGRGKTKYLLDRANAAIKEADGRIVYIDKSLNHMYELNNKIRLVDASRYPLRSGDEFMGFILGIVSSNYDTQQVYLDSFLKLAKLEKVEDDKALIKDYINQLNYISGLHNVDFIISMSKEFEDLDPELQQFAVTDF